MTNIGWQGFAAQLHSCHMLGLKVTPGDDIQLLFPIHVNVFLLTVGNVSQTSAYSCILKEGQSFVSSPANFCQLLLSFVGYFDCFLTGETSDTLPLRGEIKIQLLCPQVSK